MKNKKVILVIILIILGVFLTVGIINKTFFKNYYEVINLEGKELKIPLPLFSYYEKTNDKNDATFSTIRKFENVQDVINKYMDNLQTCYDESYFYDADLDITIIKYYVEKSFPFNKIHLKYNHGNYCENEYVLDNNWLNEFIDKAQINEVEIKKCIIKNDTVDCDNKNIINEDFKQIFNNNFMDNVTRIENKSNITIKEDIDYYLITAYYTLNNNSYMLSIFKYGDYIAFKVIDANDHAKNAIYNINQDVEQLFKNIYDTN